MWKPRARAARNQHTSRTDLDRRPKKALRWCCQIDRRQVAAKPPTLCDRSTAVEMFHCRRSLTARPHLAAILYNCRAGHPGNTTTLLYTTTYNELDRSWIKVLGTQSLEASPKNYGIW